MEDGLYVKKMPANWYSSDGYADKMISYLDDREKTSDHRPFFAYLAFTAPHFPLQAPQESIVPYRGVYNEGPDALRERRLRRMIQMGLMEPNTVAHPFVASESPEWDNLSNEQRRKSARAMECFAGMVHRMDENIGKVLDKLEEQKELDNTVVVFLSDNGSEGAAYEAYPVIATSIMEHLATPGYYNNSIDNLGNPDSFVWYGPRWAQASTAPSRLFKTYNTEGGTRVPMVIRGPGIKRFGISHSFSTIMDITPTVLEMAGVKHPGRKWNGRDVVPMRGLSMLPWLRCETKHIHDEGFVQGWELCGRAAIRKGNWKANFVPAPRGPDKWELHDLSIDRGETNDISEKHPKIMKELMGLWEQYMLENGVIGVSPELGTVVVPTEEQLTTTGWMEFEYWKPGAREQPEKFFVDVPKIY
ncbi:uncharacterized protein PFLUO_LOCUS5248 [Penicillium psychrofluorescens]|uniref:uncharacterized protein n=1 Tax=Penicillium psychrofluorescens TaxID=3158075 RepID=UPI003CCD11AB